MNKLAASCILLAVALAPATAQAEWQPTKPLEFVVGASPGGGTDQFARVVQAAIQKHDLTKVGIKVVNKPAGAGAESFTYGKMSGVDPHKLFFATHNQWLVPLVAKVGYESKDLTPLVSMAADEFILWTHTDAPYKSAKDVIATAKEKGKAFRWGGSQAKDTDHILARQIENATGVGVTYIPFKSGGEVAVQLAGGHVEVNTNNPNENIGQWQAGKVRPLCVFAKQRFTYTDKVAGDVSWADIPTCAASGIPIEEFNMPRTVFTTGGVSAEQIAYYEQLFAKVRETPEWKEWMARGVQSDFFMTGDKLRSYIAEDEKRFRVQFAKDGWLVN
ncbi:tricarboxylate transporter [Bosea sp. Root381]|uniref:Bug family tripartite tricarboxylate transporter substrate binding protein n=1 Tax=Bosea sp. Root381 TaxID=1736524 RepID=UPI0007012272|nr:tripartite tricarboxylate transporter substrate-binding protein [Bosea sp. Root381]KRE15880.1 tricarboxylate transporter [Bosea sp. Root381]